MAELLALHQPAQAELLGLSLSSYTEDLGRGTRLAEAVAALYADSVTPEDVLILSGVDPLIHDQQRRAVPLLQAVPKRISIEYTEAAADPAVRSEPTFAGAGAKGRGRGTGTGTGGVTGKGGRLLAVRERSRVELFHLG